MVVFSTRRFKRVGEPGGGNCLPGLFVGTGAACPAGGERSSEPSPSNESAQEDSCCCHDEKGKYLLQVCGHHDMPRESPILYTTKVAEYASAVIYAIWKSGHLQLFVSRRITATVERHCIAKT